MRSAILLFLLACGDDGDKGGNGALDDTGDTLPDDTGPDDSDPPPCQASVSLTDPVDGAVDVAVDINPVVVITEADATASLASDIPGTFTVSEDGLTLTWVAEGDLEYDTTYTVTATTCTGSSSFSFSTIAAEIPDHLVGRTWGFNLSGGTITEPAALEELIGESLVPGLLGVSAAGPGTVDLRVAAADSSDEGHQDYCLATSDVDGASYADGAVYGSADEVWVSLVGDPVPVYNLEFTGTWSEEGDEFSGGTLEGELDARYVSGWIGMEPDELCEIAVFIGAECAECPDGEPYCVHMRVEDLEGLEIDTTVDEVLANDCEGCEDGEPVCE